MAYASHRATGRVGLFRVGPRFGLFYESSFGAFVAGRQGYQAQILPPGARSDARKLAAIPDGLEYHSGV